MSLRTFTNLFKTPTIKPFQTLVDFRGGKTFPILTRCDQEIGGYSKVQFTQDTKDYASFSGYLNLDIPKDNPEVTRSGYAMFRTSDQSQNWLSGNRYWDWSQYSALVMRIRGDTRKYLVNIQANTPLITDLFQHRLFLNTPGEWETVVIPLNDFVMTNWGVIQDSSELNKSEVKTFGIGLLDKQYGPFNLDIEWVKVMNDEELLKYTDVAIKEVEVTESGSALRTGMYQDPKDTVI